MGLSLHPRHPSEIAPAAGRGGSPRANRPAPRFVGRRANPAAVAIPAILVAAVVYVALVFAQRYVRHLPGFGAASDSGQSAVTVRSVDGVVPLPALLEQPPPPSPDSVVERYARERAALDERRAEPGAGAVEPVLEPAPVEIGPAPVPLPDLVPPAVPASEAALDESAPAAAGPDTHGGS